MLSTDTYQDQDGNIWLFDPPYDDDPVDDHFDDWYDAHDERIYDD